MTTISKTVSIPKMFATAKSRSIIQKMAFTGIMLGLVFLFGYIEATNTLGWSFLQVNFSIVFILATLFYSGREQTLILMLCKLFILPLIANRGTYIAALSNNFMFFTEEGIFIIFVMLFSRIKRINSFFVVLIAVLLTAIIMAWLRAAFFFPLFQSAWATKWIPLSTVIDKMYAPEWWFGISNYWAGTVSMFFLSGLIRLSIALVILMPIVKLIALKGNYGWGSMKLEKRSKNKSKSNK